MATAAGNNVQQCRSEDWSALCFILSNECRLAASEHRSHNNCSYSEFVSAEPELTKKEPFSLDYRAGKETD